MKSER